MAKAKTRLVLDTNLFVGYFLGQIVRARLSQILTERSLILLIDQNLRDEIEAVISRPKFRKTISAEQVGFLLKTLDLRCQLIETTSEIALSRDSKDDFLLNLCRDGEADFLITGDADMLVLEQFEKTKILTLATFFERHFQT